MRLNRGCATQPNEKWRRVIARIRVQQSSRAPVHGVEERQVVRFRESVQCLAHETVQIQLPPQASPHLTRPAVQDRLDDAEGAEEPRDDPSDGRDFDMAGRVSNEETRPPPSLRIGGTHRS